MGAKSYDLKMVQYTAKQLASNLLQQLALAHGTTAEEMKEWRANLSNILHFHDASTTEIAWNDVQAISMFNAITGEDVPVPDAATQGYNRHYHTSEFDGGILGGGGAPHDHRSNEPGYGGFCFSCYAPGVALPQMPWAI
jgi:hypothetical protein